MFDETGDYHTMVIPIATNTGKRFTDKFEIHFFELRKAPQVFDPDDKKQRWIQFLNADSKEDFAMLQQTNTKTMDKAVQVIIDMSSDSVMREQARLREKALLDSIAELEYAEKKGQIKEHERIITLMRKSGMTEDQINKILAE